MGEADPDSLNTFDAVKTLGVEGKMPKSFSGGSGSDQQQLGKMQKTASSSSALSGVSLLSEQDAPV